MSPRSVKDPPKSLWMTRRTWCTVSHYRWMSGENLVTAATTKMFLLQRELCISYKKINKWTLFITKKFGTDLKCPSTYTPLVDNKWQWLLILSHSAQVSTTSSVIYISRIRRFLDFDICHLLDVVRALILSRIDYGSGLLLSANHCDIQRLQRIQNWAVKLKCCVSKHDHATPSLQQLHWLRISDQRENRLQDLGFCVQVPAWISTQ